MDEVLRIRLGLQRPAFALSVDLTLPARGIAVLFGPSGCGKTSLLRCVAGLEPQARGLVRIGAQTWQDDEAGVRLPTWRRDLGYVFQEASLFEHLDVRRNLGYGLRRRAGSGAAVALQAAIELLGIAALLDRRVDALSGGERQRVGLARALVSQARLLLVDEPLSALDPARALQAVATLTHAARDGGATLVATLHHVDMALAHFPRIVGLHAGRLAFDLPAAQVTAARLAELYGGENPREPLAGDAAEPAIGARPVAMTCR